MNDTEARLKAVKYDQTTRMLEEMISSERRWLKEKIDALSSVISSDTTNVYAHCTTWDLNNRSVRLGVLNDILQVMRR